MSLLRSLLAPLALAGALLSGLADAANAQVVTAVGRNFTGVSYGAFNTNSAAIPPDSDGAVGPNDFAEFINGMFTVYAKSNGAQRELKTDVDFWGAAGVGVSGEDAVTDPRILYDPVSQRWFASQVDVNIFSQILDGIFDTNDFLLAVSETSDPAGHWNGIVIPSDPDGQTFADFPTLGVDSSGVYLSGDMYDANGDPTDPTTSDLGPSLISFPKTNLLAIPIITNRTWYGVMDISSRGQVLQPAVCLDGSVTGRVLATGNIGADTSAYSNLVTFAVLNVTQPLSASLGASTFIPVTPYQVPYNAVIGVPLLMAAQPDGTATLQANDARISARVPVVNGVLYAVHNTQLNDRIAIRWYRIRAADGVLLESGTIADTNLDLCFPSIAANSNGVVVVAFNGSGPGTGNFISSFALAGQTVNGVTTFGSRMLLQAGAVSYHGDDESLYGTSRWGDYSTLSVDPNDPTRFWSIQEVPLDAANNNVWSTQITEILTTVPVLALTISNANAIVSWPVSGISFNLETSTNLVAGGWSVVPAGFTTNNGVVSYQTTFTNRARFFRLHQN